MKKTEQLMLKSKAYTNLKEEIKRLENRLKKQKQKLKGPAEFEMRFEGWSAGRHVEIYLDNILIQVTPHRDGCSTCMQRLNEMHSIIDSSICQIAQRGPSKWDYWIQIPITKNLDPLELISRALNGRKITGVFGLGM